MESLLMNPIQIGIDIGKINDPAAMAVAEVVQVPTGRFHQSHEQTLGRVGLCGEWSPPTGIEPILKTRYIVRSIGRLPLQTSYPDVAEKIVDLICHKRFEGRKIRTLVDVTGVGQAVFDMVERELATRKADGRIKKGQAAYEASLQAIWFVRGEAYNRTKGTLGKSFLVSRMQAILQGGSVDVPDTPEAQATCEELLIYEVRMSEEGRETFGAFQTGKHDDLATALGLACLEDPYKYAVSYSERVY